MPKYGYKVFPFTIRGMMEMTKYFEFLENNLEKLKPLFISKSLDFLEEHAKEYLSQTTSNSSWYQLTHTLENSFVKDVSTGTLINTCFYAGMVEYGTGTVGKGTHPMANNYQYDANGHGEGGWFFFDEQGNMHWTKGMEAHRYLYNAVTDYYDKGEWRRILKECLDELMGGMR